MKMYTLLRLISCCSLAWMLSFVVQANCKDKGFAQFDFWLGKWQVSSPQGKLVGYNHIRKSLNSCVLEEHYHTPSGFEGKSLNIYDKQTGRWHQTWMDNTGTLLQLDGGIEQNAMVLRGEGKLPDGAGVLHRITWTPKDNGSVRQHWQTSKDNGQSWSSLFDGLYEKTTSDE